jgi:hypothetical protein
MLIKWIAKSGWTPGLGRRDNGEIWDAPEESAKMLIKQKKAIAVKSKKEVK